jgi:hypothetical protein
MSTAAGAGVRVVGILLQVYGVFCAYWHAEVIKEKAVIQFKVCKMIARQGGVCMPWFAPEEGKPMVTPGLGPFYTFGDENFQVNVLSRATLHIPASLA